MCTFWPLRIAHISWTRSVATMCSIYVCNEYTSDKTNERTNVCLTGNFQSFSNTRWNVPIAVQCAFIFILFAHKFVHLPFFIICGWIYFKHFQSDVRFVFSLLPVRSSNFFHDLIVNLKQMDSVKLLVDWIEIVFMKSVVWKCARRHQTPSNL